MFLGVQERVENFLNLIYCSVTPKSSLGRSDHTTPATPHQHTTPATHHHTTTHQPHTTTHHHTTPATPATPHHLGHPGRLSRDVLAVRLCLLLFRSLPHCRLLGPSQQHHRDQSRWVGWVRLEVGWVKLW